MGVCHLKKLNDKLGKDDRDRQTDKQTNKQSDK